MGLAVKGSRLFHSWEQTTMKLEQIKRNGNMTKLIENKHPKQFRELRPLKTLPAAEI